jgi:tetratricopeptide (TPR) repeat protein
MKGKAIACLIVFIIIWILIPDFSQSKGKASRLYELGSNAYKQGRYQEALNYFEKSLRINKKINYPEGILHNTNSIGLIYFEPKLSDSFSEP